MNHPRTPEFDRIAKSFGWSDDPTKVGDDAALLPNRQLFCCDALAEGVHFRLDWSSPEDVGWKAVSQNVADILAMGGLPTQAVWSVGMGMDWEDATFDGLARGALAACQTYGCQLVGGDTVRTLGAGFVSLSLLGNLQQAPWVRSGAKPGDLILLSGNPGYAAAGWEALRQNLQAPALAPMVARHRRPQAPLDAAQALFGLPIHAAIDLSDGLSSECLHLATASGVALVLDGHALAPDLALQAAATLLAVPDPLDWIWHGGEDHCLLATASPHITDHLPPQIRIIGKVESGSGVWIELGKSRKILPPLGWVHA